ncbi:MAG: hypothetical protein JRZ94_06355 [Nitrososphaerota archaeon]|nr:hypothetical protein [Nitrososphaerota archaeon]
MRKELIYKATNGRDAGKEFLITEMSARKAHSWATRALFAVMNAGLEVPEEYADAGFAGLAAVVSSGDKELLGMFIKTLGKVNVELAEPLLNELLDCVQMLPDAGNHNIKRKLIDEDIEEVSTIFTLQKEALVLHMSFFTGGAR